MGLSNDYLMRSYVESEILVRGRKSLHIFQPHDHPYSFGKGVSRAHDKLDLWEFEGISSKDVQIKTGDIHPPKVASPSVTVRSLYEPVLSLKNSRKEEDQINIFG